MEPVSVLEQVTDRTPLGSAKPLLIKAWKKGEKWGHHECFCVTFSNDV